MNENNELKSVQKTERNEEDEEENAKPKQYWFVWLFLEVSFGDLFGNGLRSRSTDNMSEWENEIERLGWSQRDNEWMRGGEWTGNFIDWKEISRLWKRKKRKFIYLDKTR